jgi:hypothetical protein
MFQHIFKFEHPSTIFIAGPTQAGKTHFVIDLLKELDDLIVPTPERIHWAYGVKNEKQEQIIKNIKPSITFSEGFPDLNIFDPETTNFLILDDLMDEIGKNRDCANLFTRGSHHNNITVLAIVHNIFNQDKYFRTLTLNGQDFVFFNSPRDRQQLRNFGRQVFPEHKNFLPAALEEASKMNERGYIIVRLKATIPDSLRVCTNVFKHQIPVWFVPTGSVV